MESKEIEDIDGETSQTNEGFEALATAALEVLKPPQRVIIRLPIRHNPKLQQIIDRNSAGIFQLDELLKEKLEGSSLEPYVEAEAMIEGEAEKKLIQTFRI